MLIMVGDLIKRQRQVVSYSHVGNSAIHSARPEKGVSGYQEPASGLENHIIALGAPMVITFAMQ
jgi:hypothetical protein